MTRSIVDQIEIQRDAGRVFRTLYTPTEVCSWWGATRAIILPTPDGAWWAAWGDDPNDPEYISGGRIEVFDPPNCLKLVDQRYHAKDGQASCIDMNTVTTFAVTETEHGAELRVTQSGFPEDSEMDGFYADCVKGWRMTLEAIKSFLESQTD